MSRRKVRKLGYQEIVKNKVSHQEAFDKITEKINWDKDSIAAELSKIPSTGKIKSTKLIRYIFIGVLVVIGLLRILGVWAISEQLNMSSNIMLLIIGLSLIVPVIGILAAILHYVNNYIGVSVLLILSVFRSIRQENFQMDEYTAIAFVLYAIAIGLSIYIPFTLKTKYSKKVQETEVDGVVKKLNAIVFEDTRENAVDDNILDS